MRRPLTKYVNTALTIIIFPLTLSPLFLLLLVRLYHFRRVAFSSQFKSKVGHILAKAADLHINLNIDGAPIVSRSHTHPSHSQTSRLLTSSLSLGVPVPHTTQCIRIDPSALAFSLSLHRHLHIIILFSSRFVSL